MPRIALLSFAASLLFASNAQAIVGGKPAAAGSYGAPQYWNSTLLLRTPGRYCSATLVGPRVILTAAHCIPEAAASSEKQTEAGIQITLNEGDVRLTCEKHPAFPENKTADLALCLVDAPVRGISPESVNSDPGLLQTGQSLIMAGYGCQMSGGGDRSIGPLNVGQALIVHGPKLDDADIFLQTVGAATCFGDAGGGAYLEEGRPGQRKLLGISSESDFIRRSYFASTSTALFLNWADSWMNAKGTPICGLRDDAACGSQAGAIAGYVLPTWPGVKAAKDGKSDFLATATLSRFDETSAPQAAAPPAAPSQQITVLEGESPRDAVDRVCGAQAQDYYALLARSLAGLALDEKGSERTIAIPGCSRGQAIKRIKIGPDNKTTAWELFRRYQKDGEEIRWPLYEGKGNFLESLKALNPDVDVLGLAKSPDILLTVPLAPELPVVPKPVVATELLSVQPIVGGQGAKFACDSNPHDGYPYDVNTLLDVLTANRPYREKSDPRVASVTVLVADSGLYGAGQGVFRKTIFAGTQNFAGMAPVLREGEDSAHGTQVASLVVGGPLFGRFNAVTDPRVKLVVTPIYTTYKLDGKDVTSTKEGAFSEVIRLADKYDVSIINISLKTNSDLDSVEAQLTPQSPFLFVVAAGNNLSDKVENGDLENAGDVLPAKFGGVGAGRNNLLTVAALEPSGSVAKFSNYNSHWVEIGAPGCNVPTISYDWKMHTWRQVNDNGTSIAAPLVSFAAALVKSEHRGLWDPVDIKRRLLVSADLDAESDRKIEHGRKLNIAKAVALYQDVVQTRSGLILGDLEFVREADGQALEEHQVLTFKCPDDTPIKVRDILKIWPNYTTQNGKRWAKVYFRGGSVSQTPLFLAKDCLLPERPESESEQTSDTDYYQVMIRDSESDQDFPLRFSDVIDIVRKEPEE